MPSPEVLFAGVVRAAKEVSVPFRRPEWVEPSWWSKPLNKTFTRPVPAASGWLDCLTVDLLQDLGVDPEGYSAVIKGFVATGENAPAVSGLRYRFIVAGQLMDSTEFNITDAFERHVQRQWIYPWPAFHRRTFIQVNNNERLVLQVNNTSGSEEVAIAALYGWFYPNLGSAARGTLETGRFLGQGVVDDGHA